MIDNKRLSFLVKCILSHIILIAADKYIDYYRILNKEENIIIISATELSSGDRERVKEALKKSHAGVNFTLNFKLDPTILGGL